MEERLCKDILRNINEITHLRREYLGNGKRCFTFELRGYSFEVADDFMSFGDERIETKGVTALHKCLKRKYELLQEEEDKLRQKKRESKILKLIDKLK